MLGDGRVREPGQRYELAGGYHLAAALYGFSACGEDFLRLRTELRRLFGLEAS